MCFPPSSSKSVGGASPSNRIAPYGSSSRTSRSCSAASSTRRRAPLGGKGPAGRVLERRDHVEEGGSPPAPQLGIQRLDVEPGLVAPHGSNLGAERAEDPQRPVVGRRLDEHPLAAAREHLREEREALKRSVGEDDPSLGDPVLLGDPPAQRRVAPGRPVGEDRRAVRLHGGPGALGELLDRHAFRRRDPAGERDRLHASRVGRSSDVSGGAVQARAPTTSAASCATSVGVVPTRTPQASSASFFACAVPEVPEMIAPAWPIVLPGGAVKPAM